MALLSGRVDGGSDGPGHQLQDLHHPAEVVAAELEQNVTQAELFVLAEEVDDRLLALGEQLIAQRKAEREREGVEGPAGRVGRRPQTGEGLAKLLGSLRRRVPAVAERDDPPERSGAVAADPDGRMRLLDGLGREADVAEAAELPLERGLVVRPQLLEDAQRL